MRLQLTDFTIYVLGKRDDGTFDGELDLKVVGSGRIHVPFYIEKHEDHNPKRKEE